MANMRVHELAKELNITSKDITDMLSNSEKTYKSVSGLTDAEISSVRKKFAPAPKVENKPAAQPAKQSQPVKNDNRDNRQHCQTYSVFPAVTALESDSAACCPCYHSLQAVSALLAVLPAYSQP